MKGIYFPLIGRFGNQMFQYAYARAYSETHGLELHLDPWIGDRIFSIPQRINPTMNDQRVREAYYQHQDNLIYSLDNVRQWFRIKPEVEDRLARLPKEVVLMHRRVGDYVGYHFPVVSKASYLDALAKYGIVHPPKWVTEESPARVDGLPDDLQFMGDFYRMMKCNILLRGNSSFSWWAATLGDCRVFSPIIRGKPGNECDCEFVEGNWPMLTDFDFNSDLRLS